MSEGHVPKAFPDVGKLSLADSTGQLVSAGSSSCGPCGRPALKAYRCNGGSHYVCEKCAHKW